MPLPKRKQIRLKNYDYSSSGYYFITICTQNREILFGDVVNGKMVLNKSGEIVNQIIQTLPQHHPVELDIYQIMPNHLHMIIIIVGATRGSPTTSTLKGGSRPAPTLGNVVGLFKSECSKQIHITANNPQLLVWQRNYYEHVIRNEIELFKIRQYIELNPQMWERDRNNPENLYV